MQIDHTLNKLGELKLRIANTESFIRFNMNKRRNDLIIVNTLCATATMGFLVVTAGTAMCSVNVAPFPIGYGETVRNCPCTAIIASNN